MAWRTKEIHLPGMEENIKALADAIYADKVRRARALSVMARFIAPRQRAGALEARK